MGCSTPTDYVTKISDSLLAHPSRRRQRLPVLRLVHLLVTHGSFGIPQTSLGGFGM